MNLTLSKKFCCLLLTLFFCASYPKLATADPFGTSTDAQPPTTNPDTTPSGKPNDGKSSENQSSNEQKSSADTQQEQAATKLFDKATYENFTNRDDTAPPFDQSYLLEPRS